MTYVQALDAARDLDAQVPGQRHQRYETICGPHGACRLEPLTGIGGRGFTRCLDCLTVYNQAGRAVNQIRELRADT